MKKFNFLLIMVAFLFAGSAVADSTAISASQSGAISGSLSSGQVANDNVGNSSFSYNSSVTNNANNKDLAPTLFAPALAGGTNPCLVSMSGGVSTGGFGLSLGNAYVDQECQIRESLRLMAAISNATESANQTLLREIACQSVVYWDAMERTASGLNDKRYHCMNPRPDDRTYARVREEGTDVYVIKREDEPTIDIDDCDDYNFDDCF